MFATHTPALLAIPAAVPFTHEEAAQAERCIMGRYSRGYLRNLLIARRVMRRNLTQAIAGGHLIQANEQATLMHSFGVQAVMLIRRHARHEQHYAPRTTN